MTTSDLDLLRNHRRQRSLLTGLSLVALMLAIAPRQERALFITDATGLKGFVASVPPIDYASLARLTRLPSLFDDVGPRGFFARTPARPTGSVPGLATPGDDVTTPAAPFVPSGEPLGEGAGPALQDAAVPAFPAGPGGGFPFTPIGLSPPGISPAAPVDTAVTPPTPVATDTPVVTPTPVATSTPTPGITPAVPEPTTWALMIFGFFLAGGLLRRRRPIASRSGSARAA